MLTPLKTLQRVILTLSRGWYFASKTSTARSTRPVYKRKVLVIRARRKVDQERHRAPFPKQRIFQCMALWTWWGCSLHAQKRRQLPSSTPTCTSTMFNTSTSSWDFTPFPRHHLNRQPRPLQHRRFFRPPRHRRTSNWWLTHGFWIQTPWVRVLNFGSRWTAVGSKPISSTPRPLFHPSSRWPCVSLLYMGLTPCQRPLTGEELKHEHMHVSLLKAHWLVLVFPYKSV